MTTYLCPCPLNLVDGMRMGSSSLSSESWWARAGWLCPSSPSSPVGSALLQPPDVSSSVWLLSRGADATAPPTEEPSAGPWADELPRVTEQVASQGGSVEAAGTVCCPEDSEGADGKHIHTFRTIFTVVSGRHAGELCVFILIVCRLILGFFFFFTCSYYQASTIVSSLGRQYFIQEILLFIWFVISPLTNDFSFFFDFLIES